MNISFTVLLVSLMLSNALAQIDEQSRTTSDYQSYLAHISAANSSMRLNEPTEARRWLSTTPKSWRGWEYNYLTAALDQSLGVFDSLKSQPLSQDYSSDGKLLAIACEDSTIKIYDVGTRKITKELKGHLGAVYSAKFFPGNQKILSCSRDSTIRIWDLKGKVLGQAYAGGHGLQYADISPDGNKIAYCSWKTTDTGVIGIVQLWDAGSLNKMWESDFGAKPNVIVRFSPDGSQFAVGTWGWKVGIWNTENPGTPIEFDFDDVPNYSAIDDIAFSPDGKKIAAATKNGSPRVWDIESRKLILELHGHDKAVMSISFSVDGQQIYTGGSDASISIWDINTGIRLARLFGHSSSVNSIDFSPIEKISNAAQTPGARQFTTISSDNTIRIWDAATGLEFQNLAGRSEFSYGFSLTNDGKLLATGGKEGTMSIWSAETGELINNFDALETTVNAAAFSPDGKLMVVCNWDKKVKLMDATTGNEIYVCQEMKRGGPSCAFNSDGTLFALGSADNGAYVWKVEDGKLLFILNHPGGVSNIAFSPDGRFLLTAAGNGLITVWSMGNWERVVPVQEKGVVHCIDFSPDHNLFVAVGRTGQPRIWNIETGELVMELKGQDKTIWSVAYSPKGDRIATGSADNTIRIWDAKTGLCTLIISEMTDPVYNLTFSPDGTRLYANSGGTELKVFDTVPVRERLNSTAASATR